MGFPIGESPIGAYSVGESPIIGNALIGKSLRICTWSSDLHTHSILPHPAGVVLIGGGIGVIRAREARKRIEDRGIGVMGAWGDSPPSLGVIFSNAHLCLHRK